MANITSMHRAERDRMLAALAVLRVFDEHATTSAPPEQLDRDIAPILGRDPTSQPTVDELWRLSLGLLHIGRLFMYQIATDEGGAPVQVLDGCQRMIENAKTID